MEASIDKITEGQSIEGLVVVNYGDPAYQIKSDSTRGLTPAGEIFTRLIAYLAFAEAVCIPVRHILEGDAMAQATEWAGPLLNEGLILPTQRADSPSFDHYARSRSLPDISRQRADFLDRNASRVRKFRYHDLSKAYHAVLLDDLGNQGCFRRAVDGGIRGRYSQSISRAHDEYVNEPEGTPDTFTEIVSKHAPELRRHARRWAMARYYVTPVLQEYDTISTRELPLSAAKLLTRGGALMHEPRIQQGAQPVTTASLRLKASVTVAGLHTEHERYCEALLKVREEFPEARAIFSEIRRASELDDAGRETSDLFERELSRQFRSRKTSGRVFTLVSSLLSGIIGAGVSLAAGNDIVVGGSIGIGVGVGTGLISNEIQNRLALRTDRHRRPWILAMDRLDALTVDR